MLFAKVFLFLSAAASLGGCANDRVGKLEMPQRVGTTQPDGVANRSDQAVVRWNELPQVIGSLGQPIGTYMNVAGHAPDQFLMMTNPFYVDQIDGKSITPPLLIDVENTPRFELGAKHRLRGYESAGFVARPDDPQLHGKDPSQTFFRFDVWFVATLVQE
jgi:hypothetical protein